MIVRCASCAVLVALPLVAISTAAPSASATTVNVGAPATGKLYGERRQRRLRVPHRYPRILQQLRAAVGQQRSGHHGGPHPPQLHQLLGPAPTFDGTVRGAVTITDPSDSPSQFYNCGYYTGDIPPAGGRLRGKLTVTWTSPVRGETFVPSTSTVKYNSVAIGTTTVSGTEYETYSYPGGGTVSVSGAFPGSDSGASSTMTNLSQDTWTELDAACYTAAGVGRVNFGVRIGQLRLGRRATIW